MWSTATRQLSFNGSMMVAMGSGLPQPLKGVQVDAYRFTHNAEGEVQFESLLSEQTDDVGDFTFSNIPVPVEVQTVISSTPPYPTIEIINPDSLPNLAFRVSVQAELLTDTTVHGTQSLEVFDERELIEQDWQDWSASHPERMNVPLIGGPPIQVLIPEDVEEAALLVDMGVTAPTGTGFHFLRVGRVIRDEIGELGESRPDYDDYYGRAGYMYSSNVRTVNPQPSFFGGQKVAPFGGTLHIGGHFGAGLVTPPLSDNLYYKVSFWEYSGDLANPYDPALLTNETQILDPLFNKKYTLPNATYPKGKWDTLHLGPFDGTVGGNPVKVYKRPGLPLPTEYFAFWDLMVIWDSRAAQNGLVVLTLEAFEKTGGTFTNPQLAALSTPSINDHLPLVIDNRAPVPKMYDFRTGFATFSPETLGSVLPLDPCGEMPVTVGQVNSNECILVRYSVEDGAGNAHPHLSRYDLWVEYTRRGASSSSRVVLKGDGDNPANPPFGTGLGKEDINGIYAPIPLTSPVYSVYDYDSVLVPQVDDTWPPETQGDPPSPCVQYAAEVSLGCRVRTVNGWSRLFGYHHTSRHIIIKR